MRTVTFQVSPPILYSLGLGAAIQWLVDDINTKNNMNITYENQIEGAVNLSDNKKIFIYRSVRELVVNIIKHAETKEAGVVLSANKKDIIIKVRDNGVGFKMDPYTRTESLSFGLFSIKKRFDAIGGEVRIKSNPGKGSHISLLIPAGF
ncbi:MAG: hypothetical protein HUN05_10900 [Desulfobacter sp.]|nr:MAG: hypothetical protein HUN05_10900 [Desulfobacter sp.]